MFAKIEDFDFSEDKPIQGIQFNNPLKEWSEAKEEKEYKKLFERLRKRNWFRKKAATKDGKAKILDNSKRSREKRRDKIRAADRERYRKKHESISAVNTCLECGKTWSRPEGSKGRRVAKFCSKKCSTRSYGKKRIRRKQPEAIRHEPREFKPHADGKRFHWRAYDCGKFQVYSLGLTHVADCQFDWQAEMIADALNKSTGQ